MILRRITKNTRCNKFSWKYRILLQVNKKRLIFALGFSLRIVKQIVLLLSILFSLDISLAVSADDCLGNYSKFAKSYPQERVYVHFDNTSYFKGENIYYKANVVRDGNFKPTNLSKILYVELVSPNGWVVETHKHFLKNGGADGAFLLKDTLNAGFYEVRAYTSWMLNFCAANDENVLPAFKEHITKEDTTIYNEALSIYLKGNAGVFSRVFPVYERVKDGDYTNRQMYAIPKVTSELLPVNSPKPEVRFFPEGGNLIESVPTRVAYEVRMSDGMNVRAMLHLLHKGKRVKTMFPTHEGRGIFFLPGDSLLHNDYSIEVVTSDKTLTRELPKVQKQGYGLRVDQVDSIATVTVCRNKETASIPLGVIIACRGSVGHFENITFDNSLEYHFNVPIYKLAEGVNIITLYDKKGNTVAQREFFVRPRKKSLKIHAYCKSKGVEPYERVDMDIALSSYNDEPLCSSETFSLAVTSSKDRQETYDNRDILTDLLLSSEIKGFVRNPQYYFESDDSIHNLALDLLMMVQGWTRYDFKQMTQPETFCPYFRLERSLIFRANIMHNEKYEEAVKRSFWLECSLLPTYSSFGEMAFFWGETQIKKTGTIDFELPPFYGSAHAYFLMSKKPKKERDTNKMDPHYVYLNQREKAYLEDYYHLEGRNAFPPLAKLYDYYEVNVPDDFDYSNIADSLYLERLLPEVYKTARRRWSEAGLTRPNEVIDIEQITSFYGNIFGHIPSFHFTKSPMSWVNYTCPIILLGLSGGINVYVNGYHLPTVMNLQSANGNVIDGFHYVFGTGSVESLSKNMEFIPRDPEFKSFSLFADFRNRELIYTREKYGNELSFDKKGLCNIKLNFNTTQMFSPGEDIPRFFGHKVLIQGYTLPVDFYSPDYGNDRPPMQNDYRRTLYWNPNVRTDENGHAHLSFYNNSQSNDLHISAEGISTDGKIMLFSK